MIFVVFIDGLLKYCIKGYGLCTYGNFQIFGNKLNKAKLLSRKNEEEMRAAVTNTVCCRSV